MCESVSAFSVLHLSTYSHENTTIILALQYVLIAGSVKSNVDPLLRLP